MLCQKGGWGQDSTVRKDALKEQVKSDIESNAQMIVGGGCTGEGDPVSVGPNLETHTCTRLWTNQNEGDELIS